MTIRLICSVAETTPRPTSPGRQIWGLPGISGLESPVVIAGRRSSGALWAILPLLRRGVRRRQPNGSIANSCPCGSPARDPRGARSNHRRDREPEHVARGRCVGSTHLVGDGGRGPEGSYGNTAIRSTRPNAARSPWQYCHNAAAAPARHPKLELSTPLIRFPKFPEEPEFEPQTTQKTRRRS